MLELLGFTDPEEVALIVDDRPVPAPTWPRLPRPQPKPPVTPNPITPARISLGSSRLADVQTDQNAENTGVLVARLWEATAEAAPLGDDWAPAEDVEAPRRTFRWSFIIGALAVGLTVAALGITAARWPESRAADLRADLNTHLVALEAANAEIPEALAPIIDPNAEANALAGVALPLLAFSEAANQAYASATADHGPDIPLISLAPLEALSETQSKLHRASDQVLVIHDRVGKVLDYRILLQQALVLPALLPVRATDTETSELGVALSDTLAATTEVLLQLPDDDLFAEHRLQLESTLADMNINVSTYLSALRSENQFEASRLVLEMRAASDAVRQSFAGTLDTIGFWLADAIADLDLQLASTRLALQTSGS